MPSETVSIVPVAMPQPNVNDEEVTLVGWHVADGGAVAEGRPLCEVETSKAVGDVDAPAAGVLKQVARVGDVIAVGEVFAYIGPTVELIDAHIASQSEKDAGGRTETQTRPVSATAGAVELARRHGIDVADVSAGESKVRRSDVEAFLAARGIGRSGVTKLSAAAANPGLPPALADKVDDRGELPDVQRVIAEHLARTQTQLVTAHVVMDVSAKAMIDWIETKRAGGVMTGPIPVLLHGAAVAIAAEPKLASFRLGQRVYGYRSVDIAYTARSSDGRLFTPVVRKVIDRSLDELASECGQLNMAAFRGQLDPADMLAGCLTVSILNQQPVRFHVGLQNSCQSAILTAGAVRDEVKLVEGEPVVVPMLTLTLSYDHGLMDGWEAATALAAAKAAIESLDARRR